ncbi:MAG: sigma-54-dependent Fis family transcriptional regulator [Oscillospiraceae bacterium]|jgi:two-component system response regulator AtoC|nr:sigma-54-dependent Fis family transcriptional regulator [Oscillospiraceae bacterium]
MKHQILVIDDEPNICLTLKMALEDEYEVFTANTSEQGLEILRSEAIALCLLDLRIGAADGIEVLRQIKSLNAHIAVVMITAYGSIKSSVTAMKSGAYGYLTKPLDLDELGLIINQALEFRQLNEKVEYMSGALETRFGMGEIIGKSEPMQKIYKLIDRIKDIDSSVIITGESGTGKELVARALHFSGNRKNERFVEVNCAAIPEGLLEEELFGHKRGAFTGAISDSKGKFEFAGKGTVFLDEIGDMPLSLQAKLLRVLQQKEITPIGETRKIPVRARVIAATNRDIKALVDEGKFRQDLYFRLNVIELHIPPLRERQGDILDLAAHFVTKNCTQLNKPPMSISKGAQRSLMEYTYPGNVRELANMIEYAAIFANGGEITAEDLPKRAAGEAQTATTEFESMTLKEIEQKVIAMRLKANGGSIRITAEQLGISDKGLRNKLEQSNINYKELQS